MDQSKEAFGLLSEATGKYEGSGMNHEGQDFKGSFQMRSAFPGKLISLESSAVGSSGEVYHEEVSWIGPDMAGTLMLYVSSNNHPGVTPHAFDRLEEKDGAKHIVFRFGDVSNVQSFREEIAISIFSDGQLSHFYAWGLTGGEFKTRSGSKMRRVI